MTLQADPFALGPAGQVQRSSGAALFPRGGLSLPRWGLGCLLAAGFLFARPSSGAGGGGQSRTGFLSKGRGTSDHTVTGPSQNLLSWEIQGWSLQPSVCQAGALPRSYSSSQFGALSSKGTDSPPPPPRPWRGGGSQRGLCILCLGAWRKRLSGACGRLDSLYVAPV